MHPNFRSDTMAFLTNDAANHRIALLGLPGYTDDAERDNHCGMHHSGFEFASLEDLLTRYETLKAVGIVPVGCIDHGLTMSFYYADPDGNQVELQADNYEDWRTSTEWMVESEDFARDQIGKFVDPEKIVAAFRGGMTPMEIHEEAYWGTALDAPPVVFGPNGA
jgi:catechol-2,3-dioxygenase